jgi:hypothetical protein
VYAKNVMTVEGRWLGKVDKCIQIKPKIKSTDFAPLKLYFQNFKIICLCASSYPQHLGTDDEKSFLFLTF